MNEVIATKKLTKYYRRGRTLGVKDLELSVRQGEIFGFIGPNGAGKTTTIRLLLDLIRPTAGQAEVFGLPVNEQSLVIRQRLGYLPGEIFLPPAQTGQQIINYYARYKESVEKKYLAHLIKKLELDPTRRFGEYSKGNRQKLAIILAMMHKPPLLLLDEPTSGLDPLNQQTFYELLRETKEWHTTVFFSTHILSEADRLCDRAGIIKAGRLVAVENIDHIRQKNVRHLEITTAKTLTRKEIDGPEVKGFSKNSHGYQIITVGPIGALIKRLARYEIEDYAISEPNLEELFMKYYKSE